MGTEDEHWCNVCKRSLDKKKDKYVEFELVNAPTVLVGGKPKKPKGIICQKCIDIDPKLKEALELISKAGNPNFILSVQCQSTAVCENFLISGQTGVNCRHIAMIEDRIYCKRSHPGVLKLPREKTEVDRMNRRILLEQIKRVVKDPTLKKFIDTGSFKEQFDAIYLTPSSVVEKQHLDLPQQESISKGDEA